VQAGVVGASSEPALRLLRRRQASELLFLSLPNHQQGLCWATCSCCRASLWYVSTIATSPAPPPRVISHWLMLAATRLIDRGRAQVPRAAVQLSSGRRVLRSAHRVDHRYTHPPAPTHTTHPYVVLTEARNAWGVQGVFGPTMYWQVNGDTTFSCDVCVPKDNRFAPTCQYIP
jgi:hypothetical protein